MEYECRWIKAFGVLAVGCQAHTLPHWKEHWREIAEEHEIEISVEEVEKILAKLDVTTEPDFIDRELHQLNEDEYLSR